MAAPRTISRFGRTYVEFDPDGGGGGPATWILSSPGSGSGSGAGTGAPSLPSGVYTPPPPPAGGTAADLKTGMALYFKAPSTLDLALAVDAPSAGLAAPYAVAGLANSDATPGQAVGLISDGQLSEADWTAVVGAKDLVPGARYYLSDLNPGQLMLTCPTGAGFSVVSVGQALSERTLEVEIDLIARL